MTGHKSDVWEWALLGWPVTIALAVLMAVSIGYALLFFVGETVEHFTP
jgi:hypothetical protein